jgi:hypothetical protein
MLTLTEPSSGAAPGAASGEAAEQFGAVGAGMAAAYEDERLDGAKERFQGRFRLVSADDDAPISCRAVRVRSTGGQYLTGETDADGYTQWVERDAAEALAFDLVTEKTLATFHRWRPAACRAKAQRPSCASMGLKLTR